MSQIRPIFKFLVIFICFFVKIQTQQPDPRWDDRTKGLFFLRANETISYFTNNWPLSPASATRQSAWGPTPKSSDTGVQSGQGKENMLSLIAIQSPSDDFLNRARTAADQCQIYMDYGFNINGDGKILYKAIAFVRYTTEEKFVLFNTRGEMACDKGSDDCKKFLGCVFGEIVKRGDPKKCATSTFPASAVTNFKNCALNKVAAYFMQDAQVNKDTIDAGVRAYGRFAPDYRPMPKCNLWSVDVMPFVSSCPTSDNQAWASCAGDKPKPSSSPVPPTTVSSCFCFFGLFYVFLISLVSFTFF